MLKTLVALLAIATLLVPCAGFASQYTVGTTTPIPSTKTDWTGSLAFAKFNSALGTLTGVQLDLSMAMDTILTVTNQSPNGSTGWAKTELQIMVQDAGGNLISPEMDVLTPQYNFTLGAGGQTDSGHILKNGTSSDLYTLATVLAEFNGPGVIVLPASTRTDAIISYSGGNTIAVQSTTASLTGTVTYFYTAVPEPASILSLATLLLPAAFLLRRRRA